MSSSRDNINIDEQASSSSSSSSISEQHSQSIDPTTRAKGFAKIDDFLDQKYIHAFYKDFYCKNEEIAKQLHKILVEEIGANYSTIFDRVKVFYGEDEMDNLDEDIANAYELLNSSKTKSPADAKVFEHTIITPSDIEANLKSIKLSSIANFIEENSSKIKVYGGVFYVDNALIASQLYEKFSQVGFKDVDKYTVNDFTIIVISSRQREELDPFFKNLKSFSEQSKSSNSSSSNSVDDSLLKLPESSSSSTVNSLSPIRNANKPANHHSFFQPVANDETNISRGIVQSLLQTAEKIEYENKFEFIFAKDELESVNGLLTNLLSLNIGNPDEPGYRRKPYIQDDGSFKVFLSKKEYQKIFPSETLRPSL